MLGLSAFLVRVALMVLPVGVAVYTFNFGRWLGRRRYRLGAAGVYVLALVTVAVPAYLLFFFFTPSK
jgi:hypothetical protein